MKKLKKILCMMLALVLALALAVPAFAAGSNQGQITIYNAQPGTTYSAYRLLDLTYSNGHYGYTVAKDWEDFFTESGAGAAYVTIDPNTGTVTWNQNKANDADMQAFAAAAQQYAKTNLIPADAEKQPAPDGTCVMESLPLGYYLVTPSTGALLALDTTNPNVEMYDKNEKPDIPEKDADKEHAAVNEVVHFTVPVKKGGAAWDKYTVHDNMTGLHYVDDSITVKIYNKATVEAAKNDYQALAKQNPERTLRPEEFTITADAYNALNKTQTLTVVIPKLVLDTMNPGDVALIEYDAKVTDITNVNNEAKLNYKNGPDGEYVDTPPEKEYVYSYEFELDKVDQDKQPLAGAEFELYEDLATSKDRQPIQFVKETDAKGMVKYVKATQEQIAEGKETVTTLTTNAEGKLQIFGLDAKTYYLHETKAPEGYNKLAGDAEIIIEAQPIDENNKGTRPDFSVTVRFDKQTKEIVAPDGTAGMPAVQVVNKTGAELPSTGGIGTTVFYVVGGLLMAAAVVALIVKKRMDQ